MTKIVLPFEEVESSNIASVFYNTGLQELFIKFKNGGIYVYSDVPTEVYSEFRNSDSLGKFLNSEIKGTYEFEKVDHVS